MANKDKKKALVLGIGNILLKDEGLGVRAIEFFEKMYSFDQEVSCMDGGTAGLALLSYIKDFSHIIIIDAVAANGHPGSILKFKGDEVLKGPPLKTSAHQLGVTDLLTLLKFEGYSPEVAIIGVIPEDYSAGLELSLSISKVLPEIAEAISYELSAFGFKAKRKNHA